MINGKELNQALKGKKIESWEIRRNSKGREVVYVRFVKADPSFSATIIEE